VMVLRRVVGIVVGGHGVAMLVESAILCRVRSGR